MAAAAVTPRAPPATTTTSMGPGLIGRGILVVGKRRELQGIAVFTVESDLYTVMGWRTQNFCGDLMCHFRHIRPGRIEIQRFTDDAVPFNGGCLYQSGQTTGNRVFQGPVSKTEGTVEPCNGDKQGQARPGRSESESVQNNGPIEMLY